MSTTYKPKFTGCPFIGFESWRTTIYSLSRYDIDSRRLVHTFDYCVSNRTHSRMEIDLGGKERGGLSRAEEMRYEATNVISYN